MQKVRQTVSFRVLLQLECIVHIYAISISMAKHRCKILHWVAKSNLSNTILKQVNRYIFSPGIHHQGKRLHVYHGLALDRKENGEISAFVLNSKCITNLIQCNQQHFVFVICALKLDFDFKVFHMTGINAKHILCFGLETCHSICILVAVR